MHLSLPSDCPTWARNSKTKKQKNGTDVRHGTSKWRANFQSKASKVKVTGHKKTQKWCHVYLRAAMLEDRAWQAPTVS